MGSTPSSGQKIGQKSDPTNNYGAEKSAQTTSAASGPAPILSIDQASPDNLDLIKQRAIQEAAKRGRNFLQIPLASTQSSGGGYSGIAIPR